MTLGAPPGVRCGAGHAGDDSAIASAGFTGQFVLPENQVLVIEVFGVPEPGTALGLGTAALAGLALRSRRRAAPLRRGPRR